MSQLVSIVIPVYNMEKRIEKCIKSVCCQTYRNLEIIIINDGSTDNSFNVCKNLEKKDNRIKVYSIENSGSGPARNYGIENAKGKYVYFPDADDYIEKKAIEKLVKVAEKDESDLVVFGFKRKEKDREFIRKYKNAIFDGDEVRKNYSKHCGMYREYSIQGAPWNKFFLMEVIKKYDIRYPALRRHQDEAFIARYVNYINKVTFIEDILYTYYSNDIKKEWEKYPTNYIESVDGLFEEREKNLLKWNKEDYSTHEQVYNEYVSNFIRAMGLSFSPKFDFSHRQRIKWIKKNLNHNKMDKIQNYTDSKKFNKIAYFFIKNKFIILFYFELWLSKVNNEYAIKQKILKILKRN